MNVVAFSGERQQLVEPRFKLVPFGAIKPNRAPAYLIGGLIPRVGLTLIWGPKKSGKSFVTMDAMLHVALGLPYRGRAAVEGPVVYFAGEGAEGYGKRVEAFRKEWPQDRTSPVPFYLVSGGMDFTADCHELIAAIRIQIGDVMPVAVVIDTLNRTMAGSETNDADMAGYVRAADAVREAFGCAVLIVHHAGLEESRPRGHTSLSGAVDAQLSVKRRRGSDSIVMTVELMRDGPEGDVLVSRLKQVDVGTDANGETLSSCVVVPMDDGAAQPETQSPAGVQTGQLTKAAQVAARALREAVDQDGVTCDEAPCVPAGVRAVAVETWRDRAYRRGISTSSMPRSRQLAFQRASELLIEVGMVCLRDGYAWTALGEQGGEHSNPP